MRQEEERDITTCCIQQSPSTEGSSDHSNTETGLHSGTDPSLLPGGQNQSLPFVLLSNTSASASPPPTTTSLSKIPTRKSLNVVAIAIGVTGAVLLIACGVIISFYLRRRRRKRLPPSAEFTNAAVTWQPRTYREMAFPTSSTSTPRDGMSFASSPYEPMRYSIPAAHHSPNLITPPFSS